MPNPVTVSVTGVGSTSVVATDWRECPISIAVYVVVNGTVNYTVQDTPDDPMAGAPTNWFPHPTLAAQTANGNGNYAFPTRGIRCTINSGTGSVTMTVIQAARQGF